MAHTCPSASTTSSPATSPRRSPSASSRCAPAGRSSSRPRSPWEASPSRRWAPSAYASESSATRSSTTARALARAGFRYILVSNGHAGPGHLVALEEAAAIVSRRHRVSMASFTGHMAWEFFRGRYLGRIEAALGRALTPDERRAFADDAHGGWWETSLMLLLRPELVSPGYRDLPPARYPLSSPGPPELPAPGERPGVRGRPGARRSRVREGDPRRAPDRGHGAGRGPARRPARSPPSPLAVPARPVPADRLLAGRRRPSRGRHRGLWLARPSRRRPRTAAHASSGPPGSPSPSEKGAPPR